MLKLHKLVARLWSCSSLFMYFLQSGMLQRFHLEVNNTFHNPAGYILSSTAQHADSPHCLKGMPWWTPVHQDPKYLSAKLLSALSLYCCMELFCFFRCRTSHSSSFEGRGEGEKRRLQSASWLGLAQCLTK